VQIEWRDLVTAFALYLVLEGMMPFINPQGTRRMMEIFSRLADPQLRIAGLASMLAGVVLLWVIRS
jgi:uncharacterized protein YjeT (DUF2065 family)